MWFTQISVIKKSDILNISACNNMNFLFFLIKNQWNLNDEKLKIKNELFFIMYRHFSGHFFYLGHLIYFNNLIKKRFLSFLIQVI